MSSAHASTNQTRSVSFYGLLICLGILSIGGMQGGWQLMTDRSGHWLAISPDVFAWLIHDFFLPGFFLFVFFGLTPIFLAYAMLTRMKWSLAESFIGDSGYPWVWVATVGLAALLFLWTMMLIALVGFRTLYQMLDALISLIILSFLFLPSVRKSLYIS
ncbi:hypothetical protein [Spirosoma harenae]